MALLLSSSSLLLLLLLLLLLFWTAQGQEPCTVCRDGSEVPLPEKAILFDGLPVSNCAELALTVSLFTTGTDLCDEVQNVGTLCGCEVPPDACQVCPDGSNVPNATQIVTNVNPRDFFSLAPADSFLTCEVLQAVLHSVDANEPKCQTYQAAAAECNCPTLPPNSPTNTPTVSPAPSTVLPTTVPKEPCLVCANGGTMTRPNRTISLSNLPIDKCEDLNSFVGLLTAGSSECAVAQGIGPYCGCPVPEDACSFCPLGEPVPFPDRPLLWFSSFTLELSGGLGSIVDDLTCGLLESVLKQPSDELLPTTGPDDLCLTAQLRSWGCGCKQDYQAILITWGYRSSGMFSLMCSLLIIWGVLQKERKNKKIAGVTTYHQLVLGISMYDCISSLSYIMVGVLSPRESGFYLSHGTYDSCEAQAFLIQFGLTSVFYNMCLSVYFYLVVCRNWKEADFKKKYSWCLHLLLFGVGLGMSIAALPYSGPQFGVCHLLPPPVVPTFFAVNVFLTAPISVALGVLTLSTVAICVRVYRQEKKAKKWALQSRRMWMTKKVLWQSFWYVMAFAVTLSFQIIFYHLALPINSYWFLLAASFMAPFQGTMNALVYFQRSKAAKVFWRSVGMLCCYCCGKKNQDGDNKTSQATADVLKRKTSHDRQRQETAVVSGASALSEPLKVVKVQNDNNDCEEQQADLPSQQENATKDDDDDKSVESNSQFEADFGAQEEGDSMGWEDDAGLHFTLNQDEEVPPVRLEGRTNLPSRVRHRASEKLHLSGVVEYWRLNEEFDSDFSWWKDEEEDEEEEENLSNEGFSAMQSDSSSNERKRQGAFSLAALIQKHAFAFGSIRSGLFPPSRSSSLNSEVNQRLSRPPSQVTNPEYPPVQEEPCSERTPQGSSHSLSVHQPSVEDTEVSATGAAASPSSRDSASRRSSHGLSGIRSGSSKPSPFSEGLRKLSFGLGGKN